jgi:hypothetical protein
MAKIAGWAAGGAFFVLLAWLLTRSGWPLWTGLAMALGTLLALGWTGLRYLNYPPKLRRREETLAALLADAGLTRADSGKLARQAVRVFQGDASKLRAAMAGASSSPIALDQIMELCEKSLKPVLTRPVLDARKPRSTRSRWIAELKRSFTLALFTSLWFLFVPIPGLLVFSGLGYRVSMPLPALVKIVLGLIAAILLAYGLSRLVEKLTLRSRIRPRLNRFQARLRALLARRGALTDAEISCCVGCFTDALTYTDQRGYSYAMRSLEEGEAILLAAEGRSHPAR